ncbi:hypothetical protein BJX70DRAFT_279244 [Aspergillus crustosus]
MEENRKGGEDIRTEADEERKGKKILWEGEGKSLYGGASETTTKRAGSNPWLVVAAIGHGGVERPHFRCKIFLVATTGSTSTLVLIHCYQIFSGFAAPDLLPPLRWVIFGLQCWASTQSWWEGRFIGVDFSISRPRGWYST